MAGRRDCPAGLTHFPVAVALVSRQSPPLLRYGQQRAPARWRPAGPRNDRSRILRAFNVSLAAVLVLVAVFALQGTFDWRPWAVAPLEAKGLLGLIGGPMLHASVEHIAANSIAILILGTLAGSVYPKATVRALPLLWLGSGIGAWMLGNPGSVHLAPAASPMA